jgi:Ca2+-binding EF-hand superfamily protein
MKNPTRLLALAAVTLPFGIALAQSPTTEPGATTQQPSQGGATFESLDADGDGKISKVEAEANANVKSQFSSYDVNADGFIERSEVAQVSKPRTETPQQ